MLHNLDYLENLSCIMLSPLELLQGLYPNESGCSNPDCSQFSNTALIKLKNESELATDKDQFLGPQNSSNVLKLYIWLMLK